MTTFHRKFLRFSASMAFRTLLTVSVAGLVLGSPAWAGSGSNTPASSPSANQKKLDRLRDEILQTQKKLTQIQHDAIKASPKVRQQQKAFSELLLKEMDKHGHHSKKEVADLKAMAMKLRDKKVTGAQRKSLEKEFHEKILSFQTAQRAALASPDLKKARHDLGEAIYTAMKKHDPNTEKLLAKLAKDQREFIATRKAAGQKK